MSTGLFSVFERLEATAIGEAVRQSIWLFPAIQSVHLLALAVLGGAVLLLDLRLMGVGLRSQSLATLERQTRPLVIGAVATLVATGVPQLLSEALKLYDRDAFWVKMAALITALVFTFAIRSPFARRNPAVGAASRAVALVSLSLWLVVAGAGRWIGFS